MTRFNGMRPVVRYGDAVYSESMMWTDPETVDMFDLEVIAGDIRATLNDNASMAFNEEMAEKYFGDEDPIGKVITVNLYGLERDYRIGAVFKNLPHNTVLDFSVLAMIDEQDFVDQRWEFADWYSVNNYVFFQLKDGASIETIKSRIPAFTDTYIEIPPSFSGGKKVDASSFIKYSTQPLVDIQLYPQGRAGGEMKPTGSIDNVLLFSAIAGLILLIACINFMNLATAKSTQRAREVALRKVLGANRGQLIFQFLGESVMIALIGLVFGIVLVEMVLPSFGDFVSKDLVFNYADGMTLAILLGLVCFVGVVGGVYPALVLSGFLPARVLKANKSAESSGSTMLRTALVVVQFTISIALVVSTGVVYGQKYYATNLDPGFNKENLFVLYNIGRTGVSDKRDALKEEIARLPGVVATSLTSDAPASGNESNRTIQVPGDGTNQDILIGNVDYDFLETYQIPLLAGRNYSREFSTDVMPRPEAVEKGEAYESSLIVNEGALRRMGFASPQEAIGKMVKMGYGPDQDSPFKIIGVVPDVNFQSLRTVIRPEMYILDPGYYGNLTVRFEGDSADLIEAVENVWKTMITDVPYEYGVVDERMAREFTEETNQSIILGIFAGLAIVIACLGLYGLASFTAERRTKEIGIRKVMGASVLDIVRLLLWQFSKPVMVANLIAWPLASWGMMNWLESFPYRLDDWVLVPLCLAAGLLALLIAWITVGGNAAKVARSNPIKALRYE